MGGCTNQVADGGCCGQLAKSTAFAVKLHKSLLGEVTLDDLWIHCYSDFRCSKVSFVWCQWSSKLQFFLPTHVVVFFLPDCAKWTTDCGNHVWPPLLQRVPPCCPGDCRRVPNLPNGTYSRSIFSHLYMSVSTSQDRLRSWENRQSRDLFFDVYSSSCT